MPSAPKPGPKTSVTIFVCQSCESLNDASPIGQTMVDKLKAANPDPDHIAVTGVECLAVCDRPVTVTFAAADKWSYILGDIDEQTPVADIFSAARAVAASEFGVPAMADRPSFFRDGVVARVPPPAWQALS